MSVKSSVTVPVGSSRMAPGYRGRQRAGLSSSQSCGAQLSRVPIGTSSSMSEKAAIRTRDPTPAASVGPAPYPVAVSDSPLELCRRYRDAFFARDVEAILALVTPDFVFENDR
jgi:hypothetical protein